MKSRLPTTLLSRAVRKAVGRGRLGRKVVTLAVVDAAEMARLNLRFLRHRGPTDVLAFPAGPGDPPRFLGEVAVCPAVARREARARGIDWREELARYAVHGCLHLLGYDDHTPARRARMWKRQERVLSSLLASFNPLK